MILKVYSVFDSKSGAFMQPFFARADGEAIRMVQNSMYDANSMLTRNPEDFALWHLGSFNDSDGALVPSARHMTDVSSLRVANVAPVDGADFIDRSFAERN